MRSRFIARLWILSALISLGLAGVAYTARAQPAGVGSNASPVVASTAPTPSDAAAAVCAVPKVKSPPPVDPPMYEKLLPIAILLVVIGLVVSRLPRVELGHSAAFRRRRLINWLVLGLTYSFLYMARYNLNQFKYVGGLTEGQFGTIFGWGSAVYGIAFLLNGPLTDRWGGRTTILIAAGGAAATNLLMGYMIATGTSPFGTPFQTMLVLYCANMYFQSFGAVSIVKVNGSWFHLRERGTFGGIFGILISLGLFFAYDGGKMITDALPKDLEWLFYIPAGILVVFFALCWLFVRDTPAKAGLDDFDLGDASKPDDGHKESALHVIWRLLSNPIILTIAIIELCSGFLRQAILQWGRDFSSGIGLGHSFVIENWGVVSCIAGITGGMFAGAISDHLFQSRRGPVAAVLYSLMLAGSVAIIPLLLMTDSAFDVKNVPFHIRIIPWVIAFMSMAIIGVHGMLSGTASADFGGRKNTGVAVGIIDGFVYAGSMIQSFIYGAYLPEKLIICPDASTRPNPAARVIENWRIWPYAMIPVALIGFVLALRLWNARAKPKTSA
jgi:OPA family glycerol-3-phosphate transporter-like MFS transporter